MSAQDIPTIIDQFWKSRLAGDKAGIYALLAPDARYDMNGANAFLDPETVGPTAGHTAADRLVDMFQFHNRQPLSTIVDGSKAAAVSRLEVSLHGGKVVTSEVCDLFEFDDAGKIKVLRQFVDTDLVRRMMAGEV